MTMLEDATVQPAVGSPFDGRVMRPVECRTVAALYVEPKGCYVGVPGVLESRHASQRPASQKSLSRCLSSQKAREGKANDSAMEGCKSRQSGRQYQSMAREECRKAEGIQIEVPGKEPRFHTRNAGGLAGQSWLQRFAQGARGECAATASLVRAYSGLLRRYADEARRRLRNLQADQPRHEELQPSLCRSLPRNKPRAWPSMPSLQHDVRGWIGSSGNTQDGGLVS